VTAESGVGLIEGFTIQNGRDGVHVYSGVFTLTHNLVYSTARQGIEVTTGIVWIESNIITDTAEEGISINGGTAVLSANLVYATGIDGIHASGTGTDVTIRGNTVYGTASDGIDGRGQAIVIASNTVYDTGKDGIRVEGVGSAHIQDNVVYSATVHGIYARDVASVATISGNVVHDTGLDGDGIYVREGGFTIAGNTVYDTAGDGVRAHQSSTNVEIRGNAVYTAGDDGVDARGTRVVVTGNIVSNCTDNGIKSEEAGHTFVNANQVYGAGDAGIDLDDAGTFTVTNNVVVDSSRASVLIQTAAGSRNLVGHNTLVGSAVGRQGDGISVTLAGVPVVIANNAIVSHEVGIHAVAGATLIVENTLLWANGDDPVSGSAVIPAAPLFVAPASRDYHLLPGSPAIDAGIANIGVSDDVDGQPRPIGPLPDVGADEFPAALSVIKHVHPVAVQPGRPLTYTIHVTNTGLVSLTATVTDTLPDHVSPAGTLALPGTLTWTATLTPAAVWAETVVVTVDAGCVGPLVNVVRVATDEGASGAYTHTLAPDLAVVKRAHPGLVKPGERLTYTVHVTNTGNFTLSATITDTLPLSITSARTAGGTALLPGEQVVWMASIPAPDGVWTETLVVTVEADCPGPLVNVVRVTTAEGATGVHVEITPVLKDSIYLPSVLRSHWPLNLVQNPGFEGLTCDPDSPPGWCYGNWTHETHDGGVYDNIFTPQGWVTWWYEGDDYGRPEVKTIPNVPPFTGPPLRIHSGNYAVLLFTFYRLQDTGIYQVVTNLSPGATVRFSAHAHGWSCDSDEPMGYSCGDPWNQTFQVGIEPDGVADPFVPSIIWSTERTSPDYYSLIGPVTARVGADGSVCVYLRSRAKWAFKHLDAYWDDTELIVQSPGS
jgi:uncharacterized repeat protein (TIGR01451 family)